MAIARGAGTEIIRSIHFEAENNDNTRMIIGVQHHIYTVLSVIVHAVALNADGDYIAMHLVGYDSRGGTTAQTHKIFEQEMSVKQTFVWNDKFSFNGYEPVDFSGAMDSAADQDAIADQGSSVAQILYIQGQETTDDFDVICTYIDQNNE